MIRNTLMTLLGMVLWFGPCLLWWGAMLLLISACISTKPQDPPPVPPLPATIVQASDDRLEAMLEPPLVPWALAMLGVENDEDVLIGQVRPLRGPHSCKSKIPLPYLLPDPRPPVVGAYWQCTIVTSVSSLPPEPDWFLWLLVSSQPPATGLPAELSPIGMQGCMLQVNPELMVSIPPGSPRQGGALMVWREPERGRAFLRWRPLPGMAGRKLWLQALVHAPERGFLTSYGLELTVGSGSQ